MTLDDLTPLVEAWYEVGAGELGFGAERTAGIPNLSLRTFYARLGKLPEPDAPWWRHGGQDRLFPMRQLKREGDIVVFGAENQGCFSLAATDKPQSNVLGEGDGLSDDRLTAFTDLGVPIEECLVTFVLREIVFTVATTDRASDADVAAAKTGCYYRGRYACHDVFDEFWLANDVWLLNNVAFDTSLIALKGAWRGPRRW